MAEVTNDLPTSLEQIINHSTYVQTKREIDRFLRKLVRKRFGRVDTVVKVTRKGNTIFSCFEDEYPNLKKFQSIRDDEIVISAKRIEGMRVLVFDDSVRSGSKMTSILRMIFRHNPKSVTVCAVLINTKAKKQLHQTFPSKKIRIRSFRCFKTYSAQQTYFREHFISFLEGLKSNMNTDFPLLELMVAGNISSERISRLFEELTISGKTPKVSQIGDYLGLKEKTVFSIVWETYKATEPASKIFLNDVNQCKVRAYVAEDGLGHRIDLVAMIDPIVLITNPDVCKASSLYPENCLSSLIRKAGIEVPEDTARLCHTCALYQIFSEFLEELASDVKRVFKKHGLSIIDEHRRMPRTEIENFIITLERLT